MLSALDVHRDLLSRGVPHEVVRLPGALLSADDLPRILGVPPDDCVAVRCYRLEDPPRAPADARGGRAGGVTGGAGEAWSAGDPVGSGVTGGAGEAWAAEGPVGSWRAGAGRAGDGRAGAGRADRGRAGAGGAGEAWGGGRSGFVAVLMRAGDTPDVAALRAALRVSATAGVRAATANEVNGATDYAASLVCPVQLPPAVRLLADAPLTGRDVVYTALGEGGVALAIRAADLLSATGAQVAEMTARPLLAEERSGWDGRLEAAELSVVDTPIVLDLDQPAPDAAEQPSRSPGASD